MAQRNLAGLYGRFSWRVDALSNDFLVAPPSPVVIFGDTPAETIISYSRGFLVNRLFHLWGEFCRMVVIQSALGGCRTLGGTTLLRPSSIRGISDISTIINLKSKLTVGPGSWWGAPNWTTKQANNLMVANRAQIVLGLGAAPYDTFRRVRNFMVHPNVHTRTEFEAIPSYSLVGVEAEDLLLSRLPGGGTVLEDWGQEFKNAALNVVL